MKSPVWSDRPSEPLRCPFCNSFFKPGQEWRDHFSTCPDRDQTPGSQTRSQNEGIEEIRSIEQRLLADQEEISQLHQENRQLAEENLRLKRVVEAIRAALSNRPT